MTIEFGSIRKYNSDRGFGFVSRTFFCPRDTVFFHIKKIKKKHLELAQKLDSGQTLEMASFWYEIETTHKGEQVSKLWLSAKNIPQSYTNELSNLIQTVEDIWKNVDSPQPSWLDFVTTELVGVARKQELSDERDNIKNQRRAAEENQRRKTESLRENEIGRIANNYGLKPEEADELHQLLIQMRPLNFTRSKQLSQYIVKHRLGYKYKHISGILRMEDSGTEWDFHGGFPPEIYRIICKELGLSNQGTYARPVKFTAFGEL